jgi:parallel beta-helix repeat protein
MSIRTVGVGKTYATIQAALDNLFTTVGTADYTETHTIEVYNGTYTETVAPNPNMKPTVTNRLVITSATGNTPIIDAQSIRNYCFSTNTIKYFTLRGFKQTGALLRAVTYDVTGGGVIIEQNTFYKNAQGMRISTLPITAPTTIIINNIFYKNYDGIQINNSYNCSIYNNTFYAFGEVALTTSGVNTIFKNNIVWTEDVVNIIIGSGSIASFVSNNNCFYRTINNYNSESSVNIITANSIGYTLATWQAFSGQDLSSRSAVNPKFVDISTEGYNNFAIKDTSPCVGVGENLSAIFTTDFNGATRVAVGAWDIGAIINSAVYIPVISGQALSNYAPTQDQNITATCNVLGTPNNVTFRVNGKVFLMALDTGTVYTKTIKCIDIGLCSNATVEFFATNNIGGDEEDADSTLTISQSNYTNQYNVLLGDLKDLLNAEFATAENMAVLIGDRVFLGTIPAIVLEPYDKEIQQGITYGKKDYTFRVNIWIYHSTNEEEQSVKSLSETSERVEELLIDNVQNPVQDGSKWYQSEIEKVEYGVVNKANETLRTCKLTVLFKKRITK